MKKRTLTRALRVTTATAGPVSLREGDVVSLAARKGTGQRCLVLHTGGASEEYDVTAATLASVERASTPQPQPVNFAADAFGLGVSLARQGRVHSAMRCLMYAALDPSAVELTAALGVVNAQGSTQVASAATSDDDALAALDAEHLTLLQTAVAAADDPEEAMSVDMYGLSEDDEQDDDLEIVDNGDADEDPQGQGDPEDDFALTAQASVRLMSLAAQARSKGKGSPVAKDAARRVGVVKLPGGKSSVEFMHNDYKGRRYRFFHPEKQPEGVFAVGGYHANSANTWLVGAVVARPLQEDGKPALGWKTKAEAQAVADYLNEKFKPSKTEQSVFTQMNIERLASFSGSRKANMVKQTKGLNSLVAASAGGSGSLVNVGQLKTKSGSLPVLYNPNPKAMFDVHFVKQEGGRAILVDRHAVYYPKGSSHFKFEPGLTPKAYVLDGNEWVEEPRALFLADSYPAVNRMVMRYLVKDSGASKHKPLDIRRMSTTANYKISKADLVYAGNVTIGTRQLKVMLDPLILAPAINDVALLKSLFTKDEVLVVGTIVYGLREDGSVIRLQANKVEISKPDGSGWVVEQGHKTPVFEKTREAALRLAAKYLIKDAPVDGDAANSGNIVKSASTDLSRIQFLPASADDPAVTANKVRVVKKDGQCIVTFIYARESRVKVFFGPKGRPLLAARSIGSGDGKQNVYKAINPEGGGFEAVVRQGYALCQEYAQRQKAGLTAPKAVAASAKPAEQLAPGIETETGPSGRTVMFEPPPAHKTLTRRVFRRMPDGSLEWAVYEDWKAHRERARFYGFASRELPPSMTS